MSLIDHQITSIIGEWRKKGQSVVCVVGYTAPKLLVRVEGFPRDRGRDSLLPNIDLLFHKELSRC